MHYSDWLNHPSITGQADYSLYPYSLRLHRREIKGT